MINRGLFLRHFDWQTLGLNAASGLVNSLFGIGGNAISYKQQKALMDRQYNYQKDFFNYTSEYNSPSNQVARLEEAGINPALSLGQIQTIGGQTGSMPNATSPSVRMGQVDFNRALLEAQQRRQLSSQSDYTRAEADKSRAEAIGIMYDNYRKAFLNKDERMQEEFKNQMRVLSTQADMQANTADLRAKEISYVEAKTITEVAKRYNVEADTFLKIYQAQTEGMRPFEIASNIAKNNADISLKKAQALVCYAQLDEIVSKIGLNNALAHYNMSMYTWQALKNGDYEEITQKELNEIQSRIDKNYRKDFSGRVAPSGSVSIGLNGISASFGSDVSTSFQYDGR